MIYTYTTKKCNVIDATNEIYLKDEEPLMAYDIMDFYYLFDNTTSTYALQYKFTSEVNSTSKLLNLFNSIGIDLQNRNLIIHIAYPMEIKSNEISESMDAIYSAYNTPDKEIICIPTQKKDIKYWLISLYLFDEHLIDTF